MAMFGVVPRSAEGDRGGDVVEAAREAGVVLQGLNGERRTPTAHLQVGEPVHKQHLGLDAGTRQALCGIGSSITDVGVRRHGPNSEDQRLWFGAVATSSGLVYRGFGTVEPVRAQGGRDDGRTGAQRAGETTDGGGRRHADERLDRDQERVPCSNPSSPGTSRIVCAVCKCSTSHLRLERAHLRIQRVAFGRLRTALLRGQLPQRALAPRLAPSRQIRAVQPLAAQAAHRRRVQRSASSGTRSWPQPPGPGSVARPALGGRRTATTPGWWPRPTPPRTRVLTLHYEVGEGHTDTDGISIRTSNSAGTHGFVGIGSSITDEEFDVTANRAYSARTCPATRWTGPLAPDDLPLPRLGHQFGGRQRGLRERERNHTGVAGGDHLGIRRHRRESGDRGHRRK